MARRLGWVAAVGLALCAGCGGESLGGAGSPRIGGKVPPGGATTGTGGSVGPGAGPPPGACGQTETVSLAQSAPADVLILMDRSATMGDDADGTSCGGGCGPTSKFVMLLEAIDELVATNGSVSWGLMFFGSDGACGVSSAPEVPVGPMTASAIENALADATPGGEAPTAAALPAAVSYLQALTDLGPRYILLVTDGKSGCTPDPSGDAGDGVVGVATAMSVGVPTLVLAIASPSDAATTSVLNQLAKNGGEPAQGATAFYTPGSIGLALAQPATTPFDACTIPVNAPLDAGTSIAVYGIRPDGSDLLISHDGMNGWEYLGSTETAISLDGTSCAEAKNGTYTSILVDYQCDVPGEGHSRPVASMPSSSSPSATR